MTYTREQVEQAIRGAIMDLVAALDQEKVPARKVFADAGDAIAIGQEIFHRLDQIEPAPIEPNPAPKENKDEKRTGQYQPSKPESEWTLRNVSPPNGGNCLECGQPWGVHRGFDCPSG